MSNEQEQIERERYNAEAAEAARDEVETPDPPPVSPEWQAVAAECRDGAGWCLMCQSIAPWHQDECVFALVATARAADALRHQQELEDQAQLIARANQRAVDLRAALSTAEATIQQQAKEHEELKAAKFLDAVRLRDALTQAEAERDQLKNQIVDLGARVSIADEERAEADTLRAERDALEFTNGSMSAAIDLACSGAIAASKEADTLRSERDRLHAALIRKNPNENGGVQSAGDTPQEPTRG